MNPSFMALAKIKPLDFLNIMMGKHVPKAKGKQETSINGRAFAPGHGVQQEISSEAKEANVRAHLDKLASECKARYLDDISKYPDAVEVSTKVDETSTKEETLKALHDTHAAYIKKRQCPTIEYVAAERNRNAQAYIDRQLEATEDKYPNLKADVEKGKHDFPRSDMVKEAEELEATLVVTKEDIYDGVAALRVKAREAWVAKEMAAGHAEFNKVPPTVVEPLEPKYPTSDLIDALHEHIAEQEAAELLAKTKAAFRASNACIHTGERVNLGTKFEAQ